jgi:hypothetical protein
MAGGSLHVIKMGKNMVLEYELNGVDKRIDLITGKAI